MTREKTRSPHLLNWAIIIAAGTIVCGADGTTGSAAETQKKQVTASVGVRSGICAVLGLPRAAPPDFITELSAGSELLVYVQSPDRDEVLAVRKTAEAAGLLGKNVFAAEGSYARIHLADNMVGAVFVSPQADEKVPEQELLRVLHPEGRTVFGKKKIVKPFPEGIDDWSHPYHGPDNNPLSTDRVVRYPYRTQFVSYPKFSPMPQQTVIAGGRIYKAFGNLAHRTNQNAVLNTLMCINAYNGAILWKRELKEGFLIHRNTMIATDKTLYIADNESCKLIDGRTGELREEIVVPEGISDGPVWKWMALDGGVLYALVGGEEVKSPRTPSQQPGIGHWGWGDWPGYKFEDPKTNPAFGRTFVAIDPKTGKLLWHHREEAYIDGRGVAMHNGRIYFHAPERFLACLDTSSGEPRWKNSDSNLLAAIGENLAKNHYSTGYTTTNYLKCNEDYLVMAGPQRPRLVVISAGDGKLLWENSERQIRSGRIPYTFQHVLLRDDALYVALNMDVIKFDYPTGKELGRFTARRFDCTRINGTADGIFCRTTNGSVRLDVASGSAHHLATMRPPCQDGVVPAAGHLYWGPWMCGCALSVYGNVCLAPAGQIDAIAESDDAQPEPGGGDRAQVEKLEIDPGDWPTYLSDNERTCVTPTAIAENVRHQWAFQPPSAGRITAPVTAGESVFLGDESGTLWALRAGDGAVQWKAYTGGAIFFPPAIWRGRLYAGSSDGYVYALEAATGRRLWRFRAAPVERRIPVYGRLISTWPVAGGVVVADRPASSDGANPSGVVYAAAGIADYDGTHVYAFDAVTGKVIWHNDSSGTISQTVQSGISLQGSLSIQGGELAFCGGTVYPTARYDLRTGQCLNQPSDEIRSQRPSAFSAYYPHYGQFMSLSHRLTDESMLSYQASPQGDRHTRLALLRPKSTQRPGSNSTTVRRAAPRQASVWQDVSGRRFNAFVVSPAVLLAASQDSGGGHPALSAIDIGTGREIWQKQLAAHAVKGGLAVNHHEQVFISLESGQLHCYARRP
ncbi:MAG: outer membrane protein assembly factor BamB family protein, partial [Planctomycetota bacterium]